MASGLADPVLDAAAALGGGGAGAAAFVGGGAGAAGFCVGGGGGLAAGADIEAVAAAFGETALEAVGELTISDDTAALFVRCTFLRLQSVNISIT